MRIIVNALLISFLFCTNIAAESRPSKAASILMTALKEEGIEEQILDSSLFETCKQQLENAGDQIEPEKIRTCVSDILDNTPAKDIEELSNSLNIDSVNRKATKNAESMRAYLQKRIFNAIHGKDAYEKKSLKELKFVDQAKYLDLFESQITKNMIVDVSRYCLENIGVAEKSDSLLVVEEAGRPANQETGEEEVQSKIHGYSDPYNGADVVDLVGPNPALADKFWNRFQEYKYCPNLKSDEKDPCHTSKARDQDLIKKLKEAELNLGEAKPKRLEQKYLFCSMQLVRNMCEIYRCNNVYEPAKQGRQDAMSLLDKTKTAKDVCDENYGIPLKNRVGISLDNAADKNNGQIACNLLSRMESYKNTFTIIEEVKRQNKDLQDFSGLDVEVAFAGVYDGTEKGDNQKSIDQITSISSAELANKVESVRDSKELGEELEKKCFQGEVFMADVAECEGLDGGALDANYFTKVQLDTEAETAQYLKRLEKYNDADDKELEEFLIEHGMHDYVGEIGTISSKQLVQLVKDKYKAERKALINNMKDRFYSMTKKNENANPEDSANSIKDVAKDQIAEIESNKERLETLFNYSNIVSSYLRVEDKDGNQFSNTRARDIEREGIEQHGEDLEQLESQYFSEGEGSRETAAADGSVINAENFINQILGVGAIDSK